MKERYENWKELKPLTAPVPVGTKCVVIDDTDGVFTCGSIVITFDEDSLPYCSCGNVRFPMSLFELALLPSEEPAKAERKIVSGFCDLAGYVHAVCDDGTMWYLGTGSEPKWHKTPPIPQDAV